MAERSAKSGTALRGNTPAPTQQEALEYIASLAEGLQRLALQSELPLLAYLLSVACKEADSQMSPTVDQRR